MRPGSSAGQGGASRRDGGSAGEWLGRGIGGGMYPMPTMTMAPPPPSQSSFLPLHPTPPPQPRETSPSLSPDRRRRRQRLSSLFSRIEQGHVVVVLAFFATAVAYVERVGFAVVAAALSAERREKEMRQQGSSATSQHHDEASTGILLSAFYWGYASSQVPGGWAASKFGPSAVLTASFVAWTLVTLATPLPRYSEGCGVGPSSPSPCPPPPSLAPTAAARVLVGVAQGALIPALHTALAQRVPPRSRPKATAAATSGMYLGAALASAVLPSVVDASRGTRQGGPRSVLRLSAFLGVAWLLAWRRFGADSRRSSSSSPSDPSSDGGKLLPTDSGSCKKPSAEGRRRLPPTPWNKMLRCRAIWAIVACNFAFHYALYVVMNWMPSYYRDVLGSPLVEAGGGGGSGSGRVDLSLTSTLSTAAPPPPPLPRKPRSLSKASAQALPYALMFLAANAGGAAGEAIVRGNEEGESGLRSSVGRWLLAAAEAASSAVSSLSSSSSTSSPSRSRRVRSFSSEQQPQQQQSAIASRVALARKTVNTLGFAVAFVALLSMPLAASSREPRKFGVAATCLVLSGAGFSRGGFAVNHMDVAPRYAGAVMALSNTAGTLAGVVAVSATGFLLERFGDDAVGGWKAATGLAAAVLASAGAFFLASASGDKLFGELDVY